MKKIIFTMVVGILVCFLIISCDNSGSKNSGRLPGTWTLSTSNPTGDPLGSGTMTVSYFGQFVFVYTFESYTGSITLDTNYMVSMSEIIDLDTDNLQIFLTYVSDTGDDDISFTGTLNTEGTSATGTYIGTGTNYSKYGSGDFTLTKL